MAQRHVSHRRVCFFHFRVRAPILPNLSSILTIGTNHVGWTDAMSTMAFKSFHSIWAQWVVLSQNLYELFFGLLRKNQPGYEARSLPPSTSVERAEELLSSPDQLIPGDQLHRNTPYPYPLTPQQVENSIQAFIASINKSAICALASRHNGGKCCKIVDQRNGSFNICFFVLFDTEDVKWVVRIPIEPVVSNAWAKVVSEVTTIK